MRVNIDGKGSLSLIGGKLLPIKNIDLTEQEIRALAIISTIRVYSVDSGMLINASNVDNFFKTEDEEEPKEVIELPSKSAEKVETTAPVAEPTPVVEEHVEEAPTVEETVEEPATEEDEIDTPAAEDVKVSGDEVEPAEEAPRPSKKNKKRK